MNRNQPTSEAKSSRHTIGRTGWDRGTTSKLVGLTCGRMVAQVLGLTWFLLAARAFDGADFGILSSGLILVVVIGGLSDLGTTRTVVRHVAADPTSLRSNFIAAAHLRIGAGVGLAAVAVAIAPLVQNDVSISVALTAGLIAISSGVTEVGFAALRSVGMVGTEVGVLVGERFLFVAVGSVLVLLGYGPLAVLVAYAATNTVSAIVVGTRALLWSHGRRTAAGPLLDQEGRRTAISSTLVIVGPRISGLLLVLMSTTLVVGTFTVAQKVPEALGALGVAILMPILPIVRAAVVEGRQRQAIKRAALLTAAVATTLVPVAALLTTSGAEIVTLFFGPESRPGVGAAIGLLAWATVVWIIRTYGELVLLAQERAAQFVVAVGAAVAVTLVMGITLIPQYGAMGAAYASIAGEVVVFALVFMWLRNTIAWTTWRPFIPTAVVGVGALATCFSTRLAPLALPVALAALWSLGGLAFTGWRLRAGWRDNLLRSNSNDADVGQNVGRDIFSDSIESVEYLAAPTDHL